MNHRGKPALVTALFLMGAATTLVGALPTYDSLGVAAPILLVVLRILQGIAVGGQWAGSALIAAENAPPAKRGLHGSFAQIGVSAGLFLSTGALLIVTTLLPEGTFILWGWRLPFLFSIVLSSSSARAGVRPLTDGAHWVTTGSEWASNPEDVRYPPVHAHHAEHAWLQHFLGTPPDPG
jgi:MFS family permease